MTFQRILGFGVSLMFIAGASASVTTWSLNATHLQHAAGTYDDAYWVDYAAPVPSIDSMALTEGIRLFGSGAGSQAFGMTGAEYQCGSIPEFGTNQLVISGTATIDENGWQNYLMFIHGAVEVTISGGTFELYLFEADFEMFDANGAFLDGGGTGTGLLPVEAGTSSLGFDLDHTFNVTLPEARTIAWTVTLGYRWDGHAEADTLSLVIPQNSIDIDVVVPTTASLVPLVGGVMVALRRKR